MNMDKLDQPLAASRTGNREGGCKSKHQSSKGNKENSENRADSASRTHKKRDRGTTSSHDSSRNTRFAPSTKCHFELVPGHQNTTTKDPLPRPPEIRLVTSLASKGATLENSLRKMNMGPSGGESSLQH
jgi:hypothetical protein